MRTVGVLVFRVNGGHRTMVPISSSWLSAASAIRIKEKVLNQGHIWLVPDKENRLSPPVMDGINLSLPIGRGSWELRLFCHGSITQGALRKSKNN